VIAAATQQLPGVLHTLEPTLSHYGYLAIAGLVLVEDFGVPVPGETILILGAVYAGTGRLTILAVAALGILAAAAGDNIGFALGHLGGRPVIERYGRYVLLTPARITTATGFFTRHGGRIIVVARFIPGLRQANGIIAGMSGMHWKHFAAFNVVGATVWVIAWTTLGYLSGSHIEAIYTDATRYSTYIAIALAVFGIAYVARDLRRKRQPRVSAPTGQPGQRPVGPTGATGGANRDCDGTTDQQQRLRRSR
jgi:membrane protein DedA with SNARE-associated domain